MTVLALPQRGFKAEVSLEVLQKHLGIQQRPKAYAGWFDRLRSVDLYVFASTLTADRTVDVGRYEPEFACILAALVRARPTDPTLRLWCSKCQAWSGRGALKASPPLADAPALPPFGSKEQLSCSAGHAVLAAVWPSSWSTASCEAARQAYFGPPAGPVRATSAGPLGSAPVAPPAPARSARRCTLAPSTRPAPALAVAASVLR